MLIKKMKELKTRVRLGSGKRQGIEMILLFWTLLLTLHTIHNVNVQCILFFRGCPKQGDFGSK